MVKYKEVSEKSEMKELIKNSDRLPYCFTIRSRHRENSLHESFKRKPLMTTLKHSCNSLSGIYEQECIERLIPLKHPLCLKLQKMTFFEVQRGTKTRLISFGVPFSQLKRMNLTREHSSEKYKNINSSLNIPLLSKRTKIIAQLLENGQNVGYDI
jgi:hypothetical protein